MGWDGNLNSIPPLVTIPSPTPNFLIPSPYYTISRNCSHPTQHTMIKLLTIQYNPIRITSIPCTYQQNSRNLLTEVQDLLKILVQDFQKRGLGRALDDVEKICLLLDPRFKPLCTAVCLNGGNDLQNEARALVEYKLLSFSGNVTFSAGSARYDRRDFNLVNIRRIISALYIGCLSRPRNSPSVATRGVALQAIGGDGSAIDCHFCRNPGYRQKHCVAWIAAQRIGQNQQATRSIP